MADSIFYHLGFGSAELGGESPQLAFLSGDPDRAALIATQHLANARMLSAGRGLSTYLRYLPSGAPVLSATSGMGGPSLSIVVNELVQLGVRTILRVGTCGSIQEHVRPGTAVISSGALCRQGAANDIAPVEYPALSDPFVTVALVEAARALGIEHHVGITASVDTFFEGQERVETSASSYLLRHLRGVTDEYRQLGILNYEMEAGTLFKMGGVYRFAAGCVCGVVAQRTASEEIQLETKERAVDSAVRIAIQAAERLLPRPDASDGNDALERLAGAAKAAARHAHCPYSKFTVGAAVLADDGGVFTGCNVENASYGLAICAERNAVFQMIARGGRKIRSIAIYTPTATPSPPCGACRQVLREFGDDSTVIVSVCDGPDRLQSTLGELLPDPFVL